MRLDLLRALVDQWRVRAALFSGPVQRELRTCADQLEQLIELETDKKHTTPYLVGPHPVMTLTKETIG